MVLDKCGITGYNFAVRSDTALRACRVRYARKSSFVFAFLPVVSASKYNLHNLPTAKSREQSENVYENKG